ncbi:MAG TPA: alcohol dehydrogenase catalytic domain-containing protein [Ruminiclostridium sp.]
MRAIQKTVGEIGAQFVELEIPYIERNEVLIEVKATALCKSDLDVYQWTQLVQNAHYKLPFTMGHEFAGMVVKVGTDVKGIKVGDRVAGETHIPCGHCNTCRTGNQHICRNNMGVIGRSVNGCFAQYIKVPEIAVIKLPDSINYRQGSVLEPFATAMHALSKANPAGNTIAIVGIGTIGLMAVELAKFLGSTKIFAIGNNDIRLAQSKRLGADIIINGSKEDFVEVIKRETKGIGVSAIIDMTGNDRVINQSVDALMVAGTLVHVGMVPKPLTYNNYMYDVVYKELNITGIFGRRMFETWETVMSILDTGRINLDSYIGKIMKLEDLDQAVTEFKKVSGRIVFEL